MRHQRVRPDPRQHVKVFPLFARLLLGLLEECNPDAGNVVAAYAGSDDAGGGDERAVPALLLERAPAALDLQENLVREFGVKMERKRRK